MAMWQNLKEFGNMVEFGKIQQCGRSWQNLTMVKFSKMWQYSRI